MTFAGRHQQPDSSQSTVCSLSLWADTDYALWVSSSFHWIAQMLRPDLIMPTKHSLTTSFPLQPCRFKLWVTVLEMSCSHHPNFSPTTSVLIFSYVNDIIDVHVWAFDIPNLGRCLRGSACWGLRGNCWHGSGSTLLAAKDTSMLRGSCGPEAFFHLCERWYLFLWRN